MRGLVTTACEQAGVFSMRREMACMKLSPNAPCRECNEVQELMLRNLDSMYPPGNYMFEYRPVQLSAGKRRMAQATYIFSHVFNILIVHSRWNKPSSRPKSETGSGSREFSWQKATELTLDKFRLHLVWKMIRAWEAIPFLTVTDGFPAVSNVAPLERFKDLERCGISTVDAINSRNSQVNGTDETDADDKQFELCWNLSNDGAGV